MAVVSVNPIIPSGVSVSARGVRGPQGPALELRDVDGVLEWRVAGQSPEAAWQELIDISGYTDASEAAQAAAEAARDLALSYRDTAESHKDDAETAKDAAEAASTTATGAATTATGAATAASGSATAAATSATNAATSETNAGTSATAAATSATAAATAETGAEAAQVAAEDAQTGAETAEGNAASSATAAAASASSASSSASAASTSATNAGTSETNAASSASGAATSASNAAASEGAAEGFKDDAEDARDLAQAWASEDEDVAVSGGEFSARHHALKAAASAIAAATFDPSSYTPTTSLAAVALSNDYDDLDNRPTLGGAAALDVGTGAGTVAAGDDGRLSDAREWAADTVSQEEAEAGTETTRRAWTAQRVAQAIAAMAAPIFSAGFGLTLSSGTLSRDKAVAVALTDGATPAFDASLGDVFTLSAAGNRTIAAPSYPTAGQKIVIAHTASGGERTLSLNTGTGGFRFGEDITGLTATTSGKTDYIGAIYNEAANRWDVVAYAKGY